MWVLFDPIETRIVPMFMIYSFVLGFVGLFSALAIVKFGLLNELIKITELIFIIQAIGIASYSVLNTLSGNKVAVLAGATYQALSYYSAFTMGMLVLYNFIISEKLRYAFLSSFIFRFLSILLIISCVLAVFIGGGRGAFLLMSAYFVFAVYVVFIRNTLRRGRVVKFYFYSVLVFGVVVCFISFFGQQDFVKSGYKRATAFITSEGVDLGKGSSGRDEVYSTTFEYIYKKPIIGYGPFGVRDKTIHAHNVFLELWLQFGALFLFVFPFVLFFVYFKLKKIDSNYRVWLIFLFLYPMINIQFSSAYTTSSVLWFVLGVLILSNTLCINNINKENFNETCECS